MPWNVYERGRDLLNDVLEPLDGPTRANVERDLAELNAQPANPELSRWDWKGEDHIPEPSWVVLLGGRLLVRYLIFPGLNEPAIIAAGDLQDLPSDWLGG